MENPDAYLEEYLSVRDVIQHIAAARMTIADQRAQLDRYYAAERARLECFDRRLTRLEFAVMEACEREGKRGRRNRLGPLTARIVSLEEWRQKREAAAGAGPEAA